MKNQALLEAVSEVVSEEQAIDISTRMSKKIDDHLWRNTSEEARDMLYNYGYKKPMVLVNDEEAQKAFNRGEPVFLLNKDNTEKQARSLEDIQEHIVNGGLCGNTQLTVDLEMDYILHGND